MRDVLHAIRRLALVGVVLAVLALPLAAYALVTASSPDIGDNGMGDTLAFVVGVTFLVLAVAGTLLGGGLAVLAKRAGVDPVEVQGSRRILLAAGLIVVGVLVILSITIGGGSFVFIGLCAVFAVGYLVVGIATRQRAERAIAGLVTISLLGLGAFVLAGQASQDSSLSARAGRVRLLPPDMAAAVTAATDAAPDGWAVASLAGEVTDFAPSANVGPLPETLIGQPLRGILVVDCAGSERLDIVWRDEMALDGAVPARLGAVACDPEPQVVAIEIPGFTEQSFPTVTYVNGIGVDPADEGPAGGMTRALVLVALADTPDPDLDALLASFVAAFGSERPR